MASLPRAAIRRPISFTISSLIALVLACGSLLAVPVLYALDLVTGSPRGRRVRAYLLIGAVLWTEVIVVMRGVVLWMWFFGGRRNADGWINANYGLEFWWCRRHLKNLSLFAGVTVSITDPDVFADGQSIVVGRHSSHIDAIVPLIVLDRAGRLPRYTLKQDLMWAPAMDVVGHRTPNVWIDRTPKAGSPMFTQVEQLAATMTDTSDCVIFPEGTFRTQERHAKAIARLQRTRPDLAARADRLRYVLPPRPAGTLALLAGAPDADVIVMANVGTEGRSRVADIMATIDQPHPILVHAIRHPRRTVPTDRDEVATWLVDRWLEMDDWIHDQLTGEAARTDAADAPA